MNAHLTKRCTLVLLLSMAMALAAGLVAWGPVPLTAADHAYAGALAWRGLPHALTVLACVPMCMVCIWGLNNVLQAGWPAHLVRPWVGFYGAAFLMSATAGLYHIDPDNFGYALSNAFAAAGFMQLLLAFSAERLDARFGSPAAIAAGLGLAVACGAWWLAGEMLGGGGDLRGLLLLQALPALLIPAGALRLGGSHTRGADWLWALGLYAVGRLLEMADAPVLAATGLLGGHAAMHLVLAGGTGWLAYRAAASRAAPPAVSPWLTTQPQASQRSTSASTSG